MTQIDWNEAPEWAEGHGEVTCITTRKIWFNELVYMYIGDSRSYPWAGESPGSGNNHKRRYVKNVTMRHSPWTGSGRPPVGTVCELKTNTATDWGRAEIMYSSDTAVVWRWEGLSCEFGSEWEVTFTRPIRTPAQLAAEERERSIATLIQHFCADGAFDVDDPEVAAAATKIYDAGYRRVEVKP